MLTFIPPPASCSGVLSTRWALAVPSLVSSYTCFETKLRIHFLWVAPVLKAEWTLLSCTECLCSLKLCWNPSLQCDSIWRWELWEVIRVTWGHESESLIRRDTRKGVLARDLIYWHLTPGLPELQNWEKALLLVRPCTVRCFVMAAHAD